MKARLRTIAASRFASWIGAARHGLLVAAAATLAVRAADRMALWRIVHDKCVPDQKTNGAPAPCAFVDLAGGEENGVAILKDINGIAQHLAIPTRRMAGVDAPDILDPALPNYWRAAWAARAYLNARLPHELPRNAIGLAINASSRRSQDQLHIHIDCVAPEVVKALGAYDANLTSDWHVLPFALEGRRYWARRLDSPDLADVAPFRLLADGVEGAKATWPTKRWSRSAQPLRPTSRVSSCSPIAPILAPAAMARISSIRAAQSPAA